MSSSLWQSCLITIPMSTLKLSKSNQITSNAVAQTDFVCKFKGLDKQFLMPENILHQFLWFEFVMDFSHKVPCMLFGNGTFNGFSTLYATVLHWEHQTWKKGVFVKWSGNCSEECIDNRHKNTFKKDQYQKGNFWKYWYQKAMCNFLGRNVQ